MLLDKSLFNTEGLREIFDGAFVAELANRDLGREQALLPYGISKGSLMCPRHRDGPFGRVILRDTRRFPHPLGHVWLIDDRLPVGHKAREPLRGTGHAADCDVTGPPT
jgi:hypothetical protein